MEIKAPEFNILLIEDDEDEYIAIRDDLSHVHHSKFKLDWVDEFDTGLEAISDDKYDVCLLDYLLGDRDGLEFIREAKESGSTIPIIFLTGWDKLETDLQAMKEGASDYLVKGEINPSVLERSIRYAIERNQREAELRKYQNQLETLVQERAAEVAQARSEAEHRAEQLRESEERFRALADSIPQLAWMAHDDGYIFWYNRRWYEYTGTEPQQMEGWGWQSVHDPEMLPKVLDRWKTSIATGEPFDMEFPLRGANGRFRWFLTRVMPLKDSEGHVKKWFGTNTDITEQKKAEEALRESEEKFRKIFNASTNLICITSPRDGRIIDVNEAFTKLLGFTRQEIIGRSTLEKLWVDIEERQPLVERLRAEGRFDNKEVKLWSNTGDIKTVLMSCALMDIKGEECIITSVLDITERKRAEEALRESEERFRRLFEDDLTGDFLCTPEGKILLCNSSFAGIFGFPSSDQAVGTSMLDLYIDPEERDRMLEDLEHQEKLRWYEAWRKRRDGERIHVIENLVGHFDGQGDLYEIQGYIFDDTERKQAEEALRRSREELEVRVQERTADLELRNRELQEFVFVASHDLQEPLRKIQTFSDLLKDTKEKLSAEKRRDYFERMQSAAEHMRAMIDALLDYSRVTTRGWEFTEVSLSDAVERALEILELKLQETRAKVEVDDLPSVEADPAQMTQLFQNLFENALKFRLKERPPEVKIYSQQARKGRVRIIVEDNGIGFDENFLDRIFRPFERLHAKNVYPGTGIGLAICRKVVERHGGKITAKSSPGKGSTFIIELPDKQDRPAL